MNASTPQRMLSVEQAQEVILSEVHRLPKALYPIKNSFGSYLAEAIVAPIDSPRFDHSAMDGYALRAQDTLAADPLHPISLSLTGTAPAGDPQRHRLTSGKAIRILTGAAIPDGADSVIRQEDVLLQPGQILISKPHPLGENIRRQGEEFHQGAAVLPPGQKLNPAAVGLIAGLGIKAVWVHARPKVGILVTGSEIVRMGSSLEPGQIYDSNSFSLSAALKEIGISDPSLVFCRDDLGDIARAIQELVATVDFILVTGGVSVGDFDFVKQAALQSGIREVFWGIKQKPGKPFFFGKSGGDKYLFGFPGNPASGLVCFYEYARPALLKAMGAGRPRLPRFKLPLLNRFKKKAGLSHFVRAEWVRSEEEMGVNIFSQQGSHLFQSFAKSQVLAVFPENVEVVEPKTEVEVDLLADFFD